MPANLSKRSVVKHRTNKPYHGAAASRSEAGTGANSTSLGSRGKAKSGFQVGPKHAPDGAYLGRAKKIKADLIDKAKIKKRFFKSIKGADDDGGNRSIESLSRRDEGKFAPERGDEGGEEEGETGVGEALLYQMRQRDEPLSDAADDQHIHRQTGRPKKQKPEATPRQATTNQTQKPPQLSMEEKQKIREEKQKRWHAESGSRRGRERGQPNLGARMDLLLDKIKQG